MERRYSGANLDELKNLNASEMYSRRINSWVIEKPNLENARQLKGGDLLVPNVEEYQDTMVNARRMLEIPMANAKPSKRKSRESFWRQEHKVSASPQDLNPRTKYGCIVESHESTRPIVSTEAS